MNAGPNRTRPWRVLAGVALALTPLATPLSAQGSSWLPPPVEDGAARQLADRLLALGDPSSDPERVLAAAREMLRRMRSVVESWGADGVVRRAPEFAGVATPGASRPELAAMGSWSICNLDLFLLYDQATRSGEPGDALVPALGLTAVTLVIVRLREPFVAAGGTQPEIEAHLTSPEFEALLASIQSSETARSAVRASCDPPLRELLAGSIDFLRASQEAD